MRIKLLALSALLLMLGLLQFRWIGRIGEAEGERMRTHLREGSENMAREVDEEFARAYLTVVAPNESCSEEAFAARLQQWTANAQYPRVLSSLAIIRRGASGLLRYEPARGTFVRADWPPEWAGLRKKLLWGFPPPPAEPAMQPGLTASPMVMVAPCIEMNRATYTPFTPPEINSWAIAGIDERYVTTDLLPQLARRYLGGEYGLKVVREGDRSSYDQVRGVGALRPETLRNLLLVRAPERGRGPIAFFAGVRAEGADEGLWKAGFTHRSGSVERSVLASRLLNLGVSLGVLVLLAGGLVLVHRTVKEDRRLSEVRMNLVAGVSHELRTPVAVICSAADNLADGCVNTPAQAVMYGRLVRDEGRKLAGMIEQMLEFAGIEGGKKIRPRRVGVDVIIEGAMESVKQELDRSQCVVRRNVEYGLPPVMGDETSLILCVRNLLSNAIKYGGEHAEIELAATFIQREPVPAVCIAIRDHGRGIPSEELVSVFDPFFRGGEALGSQVKGMGLGLTLVKRIVEAHAGSVEVESKPGSGTIFSLMIPAADA